MLEFIFLLSITPAGEVTNTNMSSLLECDVMAHIAHEATPTNTHICFQLDIPEPIKI